MRIGRICYAGLIAGVCCWLPSLVSAADQKTAPADAPATITVTTGGGSKIADRPIALFRKTVWSLCYLDAPELQAEANRQIAAQGYDVVDSTAQSRWEVETIALGDPSQMPLRGDDKRESKAAFESGVWFVAGLIAGVATGNSNLGANVAGTSTANNPNAKYITKDMVDALPPGAKKILLTRLTNRFYRAEQEVLTVAYDEISDADLRRINAAHLFGMLGLSAPATDRRLAISNRQQSTASGGSE